MSIMMNYLKQMTKLLFHALKVKHDCVLYDIIIAITLHIVAKK